MRGRSEGLDTRCVHINNISALELTLSAPYCQFVRYPVLHNNPGDLDVTCTRFECF